MKQEQKEKSIQKMNNQWMKRQRLKTIRQYLIVVVMAVSAILAWLVATGQGESIKKPLSIILIALIALFAGLSAADLVDSPQEPVHTTSDLVEVEQRSVSAMQNLADTKLESVRMISDLLRRPDDELHFVNYAIDGDTIKVDGNTSVRLLGINAPEKKECYYEEASRALAGLVEGEYVRLEKDVSGQDIYGRLLRYVFLPSKDLTEDDIFVNAYLLRNGYAQTYSKPPNKRYNQYFISAREQALRQNRGLWGACDDALENYKQENPGLRELDEPPPNPDCIIKGNISKRESGKTYLTPKCGNYNRVKIDTSRGEQYFCTEEEAITAGFRKAGDCP